MKKVKDIVVVTLLVLYILSPFDLLPEAFLPVVGWLDDIGAFLLLRRYLLGMGASHAKAVATQLVTSVPYSRPKPRRS